MVCRERLGRRHSRRHLIYLFTSIMIKFCFIYFSHVPFYSFYSFQFSILFTPLCYPCILLLARTFNSFVEKSICDRMKEKDKGYNTLLDTHLYAPTGIIIARSRASIRSSSSSSSASRSSSSSSSSSIA